MSREVPGGWKILRIGDLCEPASVSVQVRDDEDYDLLGVRWYGNGCHSHSRTRGSELKTRVLNRVRASQIVYNKMWVSKGAFAVVPRCLDGAHATAEYPSFDVRLDRLDPNFIEHYMRQEAFKEDAILLCKGSTSRARLNPFDFMDLTICLPPLHEQRRIAEILSSVDEAIAATRAVLEQTRKVKQGVLERLLTKGIGHTRFKQTEIGEIPKGWETGKIGDFFTLQRGFDITEKQSTAGEYPVVSSSGISYFHSEAMVHGPAVITGRKGKLGQVHFIDSSCWPHDTTLWVKDFKGNAPKFVYWFLRSLNLEKFDAATAVPTLNRNVVHTLRCAFPPVYEQPLISDHLDSIEATEDAQTRNLTAYGQMKSALMSDLLTGRMRVTEAVPMAAE